MGRVGGTFSKVTYLASNNIFKQYTVLHTCEPSNFSFCLKEITINLLFPTVAKHESRPSEERVQYVILEAM